MIKVLFMGRKQVSANCLRYLFSLQNVEIVGVLTDSHLMGSPTAEVAKELGLDLFDYDAALSKMKAGELDFDFGVSILYWRKLKEEFLSLPRLGVINFHPAPLPEYKGTAGYNLAILEAKTKWAVTAHYVDSDIDTGAIIEKLEFPIDEMKETALTLEKTSMQHLGSLVRKVLLQVVDKNCLLDAVPNVGGRYVSRSEMEAMKEVRPGDDIDRKIRAFWFPPYDGAYQVINGKKYTLVNREILESVAPQGATSLFAAKVD